jgi:hypothetical protein
MMRMKASRELFWHSSLIQNPEVVIWPCLRWVEIENNENEGG